MLVGAFCHVANEVSIAEKDALQITYLENHLQDTLECYLGETEGAIKFDTFKLMMQNVDVIEILRNCGTDIDGLITLGDILFPREDSEVTFSEFYFLTMRLRRGNPAGVSEILALQEFMKVKIDRLESLLRKGLDISGDSVELPALSGIRDQVKSRRRLLE